MDDGRLHIIIDGETNLKQVFEQISAGFKQTERDAVRTGRAIDNSFIGLSSTLDGIQRKLGNFLSMAGAAAFVKKVFQVRSYFQDIESSMEVFLGSAEKASKFTSQLKDYAWYNTFEFDELAAAAKQIIAYGTAADKVIPIIDKLSNVATATKQPLMDLVQLYNKAKNIGSLDQRSVQQWASRGLVLTDILKEMGQTVDGTKISFEQLDAALNHVTQEGGRFAGIMEKMMPNLSMSMGQLQDDLSLMWDGIGRALQGPMGKAIDWADMLVSNYKEIGFTIARLIGVFGTYKAAVIAVTTAEKVAAATKGLLTIAEKAEYSALLLAEKAQKALNKTMLSNPYVLVATAIAACVAVLIRMNKAADTTIMSIKDMNKHLAKANTEFEREKEDLDDLFGKLRAAKKGTADYEEAKDSIIKQYGKYNSGLSTELDNVESLEKAYLSLKDSILEAAKARQYANAKNTLDSVFDEKSSGTGEKILEKFRKYYGDENGYKLYYELLNDISSGSLKLGNDAFNTFGKLSAGKDASHPWGFDFLMGGTNVAGWKINDLQDLIRRYIQISDNYVEGISQLRSVFFQEDAKTQEVIDNLGGRTKEELEAIIPALEEAKNAFLKDNKPVSINLGDFFSFTFDSQKMLDSAISGANKSLAIVNRGGGNGGGGDDLTDKQPAAAYRRRETMAKNRQSVQRQEIDMEFSLEEERLNAMEDSAAKQLALAELNHRKEMEQLKRQREDKLKQLQENEKAVWLAGDPDRKEYNFKSSITEASEVFQPYIQMFAEQQAQIDRNYEQRRRDILQQEEETARAWQQKESDIRDRLEQAQIDAMDEGFDKEQRQRALNNKRELEALENEKREYVKQVLANAKAVFDAQEQAKKALNPDYQIQLFDPSKFTVDTSLFDNLIAQVGANQADELLSSLVSSYETYENRKNAIIDRGEKEATLLEKAGFSEQAKNRRKAMKQELNDLDRQNKDVYKLLDKDQKKWGIVDFERAIAKARAELNALLTDPETNAELISLWKNFIEQAEAATRDFSPQGILAALLKPNEGENGLKDRINALKEAWNDMSADQKWENIGNYVTGIASGFQKAAEYLQEIAELTGDSGLADTAKELSAAAQNLSAAGQGAATGGWIGAIVGGVVDIVGQTVEAFANVAKQEAIAAANARDYRTEIEKLAIAINEADFDSVFGEMSIAKGRAYAKNAGDTAALYEKKLKELNQQYGNQHYNRYKDTDKFTGWDLFLPIVGSIAYRASQMDVESNDWKAYQDAMNKGYEGLQRMLVKTKAQTGWAKFWGAQDEYTSLGDLAPELWENGELNVEAAKAFLETNTQITEEQRKQIENLIELKEGYDAAMEQIDSVISDNFGNLSSALTDVIWDSVVNGSKDAFAKMEDIGSEHIAKLGKQLISEMLMSEYLEQYRDQMRAAYKLGSASETQNAIRDIVGNIFGGMQQMLDTGSVVAEEYKQWALEHGFDLSDVDSTRKGATKSVVTASQDSVDEWNARTTTIQGHTYEIKEEVKAARQQRVLVINMFTALLNHVQGIHKDTSNISSKTDDIQKEVSSLHSDVSKIVTNGITIKR